MRETLKKLRTYSNEELLERLNYNQRNYNKFAELYGWGVRDKNTAYDLDLYNSNIDKIKRVFDERNIKIEFVNGWEIA